MEGRGMEFYRKRIIKMVKGLMDEEKLEIIYRFIKRYLN